MNARPPITPCIFGTSNGFEIQTLTRVPLNVEDLAFAITRSEVELHNRDECVKVFRLRAKSEIFTWIGLYRKAFEIGFSREGGYYGAGLWLAGITVNARLVLDVLKDLADQVNALAITEGQFQRPLSGIIDHMQIPPGLVPLKESSARYLRGGLRPDAVPGAYISQPGSLREIVDWAQNDLPAENFRAMIVAPAANFPRSASSRLERYADLNEVLRKLESDLSLRIARLQADKLGLQKEVAKLENDLRAAQRNALQYENEVQRWRDQCQKLEKQVLSYRSRDYEAGSGNRRPWLALGAIFASVIVIGVVLTLKFSTSFSNIARPAGPKPLGPSLEQLRSPSLVSPILMTRMPMEQAQ